MLSTNIFYSGYNVLFSIMSLFIGISSVFLIRGSKDFRGLFLFQLGGLLMILLTYLTTQDHLLYKIGLNDNFVIFVLTLLSGLISILWINSATELYNHRLANREALTIYTTLTATLCVYYSFIGYNSGQTFLLRPMFLLISITMLFLSSLVCLIRRVNIGHFLLSLSLFLLLGKLTVSTFFYQYNWLNLNIFNWIWTYIFAVAVIFMRFDMYRSDLKQSWNTIDKLNLQIINMIDTSPFPIVIVDAKTCKFLTINNKAALLFGFTRKDAIYHLLEEIMVDEQNRCKFLANLQQRGSLDDYDVMVCNVLSVTPFWMSASAKSMQHNGIDAFYITFQDIALRKERENNLQNQAHKDPLTLTWNRLYFEKFVPEKIKECIHYAQNFSLLLVDADKFKKINDKYGHKVGDLVLIEIAGLCRNSLRDDDIVARFGGEEFVIFLNDTDLRSATRVAERLRQNIESAAIKDDEDNIIKVTVSIGVVSSEKANSLEVLLRQVDDAMYLAKHNGRNQVAVYDEQQVKSYQSKKSKSAKRNIHPVFQNEESEEISLLDNYGSQHF
ncbi:MAG: sensor domain-containing diguanylate cyclase [Alphaproteobacteria bacterium]|nr:sensor domain-containing diguanylate cyclase [Alphaproteobacteria bacterium]